MLYFPYREAMGALMWTATVTQLDIACTVRVVTRFCENPGLAHKEAVLKVMKYLLKTKEWEILNGDQGCGFNMEAIGRNLLV